MQHERHRAVVIAAISLAHSLGMRVVAEGVETADQANAVIELGCDEIQGFFFSKPLPAAEFLRWKAGISLGAVWAAIQSATARPVAAQLAGAFRGMLMM